MTDLRVHSTPASLPSFSRHLCIAPCTFPARVPLVIRVCVGVFFHHGRGPPTLFFHLDGCRVDGLSGLVLVSLLYFFSSERDSCSVSPFQRVGSNPTVLPFRFPSSSSVASHPPQTHPHPRGSRGEQGRGQTVGVGCVWGPGVWSEGTGRRRTMARMAHVWHLAWTCWTVLLGTRWNANAAQVLPLRFKEHVEHNRTHPWRRELERAAAIWPLGGSVRELGYFYLTLELGTPSKAFEVIVDTGSSMAYVACSSCGKNCGRHADEAFDPQRSTTYQHVGCRDERCACGSPACQCKSNDQCYYSRHYAEGSSSEGILVSDLMAFGDRQERITFGCETKETGLIYQQEADGVMGMGRSDITLQKQLAKSGVIDDVFSLCFGGTGGGGSIIFGKAEVEQSLDMKYTKLIESTYSGGFYKVNIEDMMLGQDSLGLSQYQWNRGAGVIVDSGTTFVYLESTAFAAFQAKVMAAASKAGLPKIAGPDPSYGDVCFGNVRGGEAALSDYFPPWTVKFADLELELPPINYLWVHSKVQDAFCLGVFNNGNSGSLLGGLFARDILVQYDHDENRLGFARVKCDALPEGMVLEPDQEESLVPQSPPQPFTPTASNASEEGTDIHASMLPVLYTLGAVGLIVAIVVLVVYRIRRRYRYSEIGWDEKTSEISSLTLDMERTLSGSTELQPFKPVR